MNDIFSPMYTVHHGILHTIVKINKMIMYLRKNRIDL